MKHHLFVLSIFALALLFPAHPALSTSTPPSENQAIRSEFDALFAASPIYQAIRKNLPETYEDFFRAYLEAKKTGREFKTEHYINSIRNTYLKQASDETILAFFRYTVEVGKEILAKDPEAAFAYVFGGDPAVYIPYIDLNLEQQRLGQLYEQILATRAAKNLEGLDPVKAMEGMDYVNALLYLKYGDNFLLLKKDASGLSGKERQQLCAIYLDIFNEIFQLEPAARCNVLRSFTARM